MARAYVTSYKMPIIITRSNNVYGPGQFPEKLSEWQWRHSGHYQASLGPRTDTVLSFYPTANWLLAVPLMAGPPWDAGALGSCDAAAPVHAG